MIQKERIKLLNNRRPAGGKYVLYWMQADEMLLSGQKVLPKRLLNTDFDFKYTDVEQALKDITG